MIAVLALLLPQALAAPPTLSTLPVTPPEATNAAEVRLSDYLAPTPGVAPGARQLRLCSRGRDMRGRLDLTLAAVVLTRDAAAVGGLEVMALSGGQLPPEALTAQPVEAALKSLAEATRDMASLRCAPWKMDELRLKQGTVHNASFERRLLVVADAGVPAHTTAAVLQAAARAGYTGPSLVVTDDTPDACTYEGPDEVSPALDVVVDGHGVQIGETTLPGPPEPAALRAAVGAADNPYRQELRIAVGAGASTQHLLRTLEALARDADGRPLRPTQALAPVEPSAPQAPGVFAAGAPLMPRWDDTLAVVHTAELLVSREPWTPPQPEQPPAPTGDAPQAASPFGGALGGIGGLIGAEGAQVGSGGLGSRGSGLGGGSTAEGLGGLGTAGVGSGASGYGGGRYTPSVDHRCGPQIEVVSAAGSGWDTDAVRTALVDDTWLEGCYQKALHEHPYAAATARLTHDQESRTSVVETTLASDAAAACLELAVHRQLLTLDGEGLLTLELAFAPSQ